MPVLSTSWADGNTVHGTDLDTITGAINTPGITSQATSAQTVTMDATYNQQQVFTGSSTAILKLPTTSIPAGYPVLVDNNSTAAVAVQSSGANAILSLAGGTAAVFTANIATPAAAADWSVQYGGVSVASGTVLTGPSVSGQIVAPPAAVATLVTPIADIAVGATATKVLASNVIPANTLAAGSTFRVNAYGTQSSNTSSLTYTMYIGTSGTTGDTVVGSATSTIAASIGAAFEGVVTIRTTGAPGTCIGSARLSCGAAGGNSIVAAAISQPSTTVANYITLGMATSTQTHTVQTAVITWAGA